MNDKELLYQQLADIGTSLDEYPDEEIDIDFEYDFRGTWDESGVPCRTPTGYRIVTIKYYLP